jgi:hypothetical protein
MAERTPITPSLRRILDITRELAEIDNAIRQLQLAHAERPGGGDRFSYIETPQYDELNLQRVDLRRELRNLAVTDAWSPAPVGDIPSRPSTPPSPTLDRTDPGFWVDEHSETL